MNAPLPVITTRCADRRDRGYLAWVAVAKEVAHLQLESAPIDASPHALEIHVQGFDEPLVVMAEPVGEPNEEGFPLRLSPLDEAQAESLRRELFGTEAASEAARTHDSKPPSMRVNAILRTGSEPPSMSKRHREALARSTNPSTATRRAPGVLTGRLLGDGRFSLDRLIGAGASGEVYGGTHTALRRAIAIKVLHPALQQSPDYCARFYSEALAASQLDHRNVLRILDYGQEPDGLLYIVMELLEGKSLQDILDEEGPLKVERLVHLVAQACAGLAHAHDAGVVHRDIKPENIVVVKRRDDEGHEVEIVKVCDFGIAHWSGPAPSTEIGEDDATIINRPDPSKVVGTPAYMAPEQIRNDPVDARTDIYALGVVLFELATGRLPFATEDPIQMLLKHVNDEPPRPSSLVPNLDRELEVVIMRALEKSPSSRQEDARILRAQLRDIIDEVTGSGQYLRASIRSIKSSLTANDFLEKPADSLAALATSDDRSRGLGLDALGDAVRAALAAGNVPIAKDLVTWLKARAVDLAVTAEEREHVDRVLRVLRDPQAIGTFAIHVVEGKIANVVDAKTLLAAGGPVAARAVLEARRGKHLSLDLRARFMSCLRTIGPGALPVIVAALEPLEPLASRNDEILAEDLLRSIPDVPSDAAGEIAVRFVRLDKPSVGVVAIAAITTLWGARARPLLLGVLDSPVDALKLAAIDALKKLGAIDDWALDRFARIVLGQMPASDEVRREAADAFALALPESRARAIAFLQQRLTAQAGLISSISQVFGTRESPTLSLALARALVTLDPLSARPLLERLAATRTDLRMELESLLFSPRPT